MIDAALVTIGILAGLVLFAATAAMLATVHHHARHSRPAHWWRAQRSLHRQRRTG
jgi:hypothetical protein